MPTSTSDLARLRRPSRRTNPHVLSVAVVILHSAQAIEFSPAALLDGIPNISDFVGRYPARPVDPPRRRHPDGRDPRARGHRPLRSVVPRAARGASLRAHGVRGGLATHAARTSITITRAIPEPMWALPFVSAIGIGPLAGTLAIVIGSATGRALLFAGIFETKDMLTWEAAVPRPAPPAGEKTRVRPAGRRHRPLAPDAAALRRGQGPYRHCRGPSAGDRRRRS